MLARSCILLSTLPKGPRVIQLCTMVSSFIYVNACMCLALRTPTFPPSAPFSSHSLPLWTHPTYTHPSTPSLCAHIHTFVPPLRRVVIFPSPLPSTLTHSLALSFAHTVHIPLRPSFPSSPMPTHTRSHVHTHTSLSHPLLLSCYYSYCAYYSPLLSSTSSSCKKRSSSSLILIPRYLE